VSRKLVAAILPLVAACAAQTPRPATGVSGSSGAQAVRVPPTNPAAPAATGFRAARVMNLPGLEGVIGAGPRELERQFGTARLDVWEGDARKLQFSGEACVLDVYLYPPRPGAEATATYVDARRSSDGLDVDRAACVKALRR
jgi:hypothetical protein